MSYQVQCSIQTVQCSVCPSLLALAVCPKTVTPTLVCCTGPRTLRQGAATVWFAGGRP